MSSKMQFQVFYGDYNVLYGTNGVDLSAFKCTSSAIYKPLERSFGSICKWLQCGFRVDPLTHVITVQSHFFMIPTEYGMVFRQRTMQGVSIWLCVLVVPFLLWELLSSSCMGA